MRRSLAPSQKGRITTVPPEGTASTKKGKDSEDEITIQRMPMFGFLEVPESMNKQFKVPSGCVITEKYDNTLSFTLFHDLCIAY